VGAESTFSFEGCPVFLTDQFVVAGGCAASRIETHVSPVGTVVFECNNAVSKAKQDCFFEVEPIPDSKQKRTVVGNFVDGRNPALLVHLLSTRNSHFFNATVGVNLAVQYRSPISTAAQLARRRPAAADE
jgi:hypothetical protein